MQRLANRVHMSFLCIVLYCICIGHWSLLLYQLQYVLIGFIIHPAEFGQSSPYSHFKLLSFPFLSFQQPMSSIHTYKCLSPYVAFHHFFQSVVLLEVFFSSRMLPFPLLFFYLQENKTNNLRTCLLVVPSMTIAFFFCIYSILILQMFFIHIYAFAIFSSCVNTNIVTLMQFFF